MTCALARVAIVVLLVLGCRAIPAEPTPAGAAVRQVEQTLDALYRSFGFDAAREPDWTAMRALFANGAVFVAPIAAGKSPRGVGADEFVREFEAYVASEPVRSTGLHERIVHTRIDTFGNIAHAYVAFEGFTPGSNERQSRGLDSIQLVKAGERWLVMSFTTQYETTEVPMPVRFLGD